MNEKINELVKLQATKIMEVFTIVDFTKSVLENTPKNVQEIILYDLKEEYFKAVTEIAQEKVQEHFENALKKVLTEKEKKLEEVEYIEELEEVVDDDEDDDLNFIISHQILVKNLEIEKTVGKYKEEDSENYWMIGINLNSCSEQELQEMSIFDKDFW